ncbi:MAG TPA: lipid-binding SYLF domain-containing protein [Steroidobacteraceae bacterium]|nr:lipid-binding SYLF domain-containing protein [Steroidobacteraceae bacterium]
MGPILRGLLRRVPAALLGGAALVAAAQTPSPAQLNSAAADAQSRVDRAVALAARLEHDRSTAALLMRAVGVLLVPDYARVGWISGGQGGAGVLLVRRHGSWSAPAFYTLGGLALTLPANGDGGPLALFLMTGRAAGEFRERSSNWRLGAATRLTLKAVSGDQVSVSPAAPADVLVWAARPDLLAGGALGATALSADRVLDEAYYQRLASTGEILAGAVGNRGSARLRAVLDARVATNE